MGVVALGLLAIGAALAGGCGKERAPDTIRPPAPAAAVMFLIDGLMNEALQTAVAGGASNLRMLLETGVRVETVHSTSPAGVIQLPPGSAAGTEPWGFASSGNVAVHTGCHLFESSGIDDIFLAARDAGIKSVFAGGAANYSVFVTPDFHYGDWMDDPTVLGHAIRHLQNDGARLLRIHLQRIRDVWTGPADKTNPGSAYIQYLSTVVDALLGDLIRALKEAGIWERTLFVLASDHGMDDSGASNHAAGWPSSWRPILVFSGPGLKQGATIPYAELPDVAVTVAHLLGLRPLRGHLDPALSLPPTARGPSGTVLTNLLAGAPPELPHPRLIERCLQTGLACTSDADDYGTYRRAMLSILETPR